MGSWGASEEGIRFQPPLWVFWTKPKKNGHTLPPCWVHLEGRGGVHMMDTSPARVSPGAR